MPGITTSASRAAPRSLGRYRRRRPESTLLYQTVAEHLEDFLGEAEHAGEGAVLPAFVQRELRAFLRCGILEHGFARVHCSACKKDTVVAFS